MIPAPNRLLLDTAALVHNWRSLARMAGVASGAAVKADGYGLGARAVVERLAEAGCRDIFVATWQEAEALAGLGVEVSVLHGVRDEDLAFAGLPGVRPVLNSATQVARWRQAGGGPCDVMIDTGMNRLGLSPHEVADGVLGGLAIETLMSHLACADEDRAMNLRQRDAFATLTGRTGARRMSLANSAGIALGPDYAFDLVRPGIALYGGVPCAGLDGVIRPVVTPQAQVIQRRRVSMGETVGYNATWIAPRDTDVAILNLGYADGYLRGFSDRGTTSAGPVIGRVSMDLVAVDVSGTDVAEGDWIGIDYALPSAARVSGLSQYELLTGLGVRFDRIWA